MACTDKAGSLIRDQIISEIGTYVKIMDYVFVWTGKPQVLAEFI